MSTPAITPPADHDSSGVRKRVCKACDRCRLKKSKCDGVSPCSRCRQDNTICLFGERKKSHDKVYPKGYVEMLETHTEKLTEAIRILYQNSQHRQGFPGGPLQDSGNGFPQTHDILQRLGVLKSDGRSDSGVFDLPFDEMQRKLLEGGAGFMHPHGSPESHASSEFEQNQISPVENLGQRAPVFQDPFSSQAGLSTPPIHSPPARFSGDFQREPQLRTVFKQEAQLRPQSTYGYPAQLTNTQPSMIPNILAQSQRNSWQPVPPNYEDVMPQECLESAWMATLDNNKMMSQYQNHMEFNNMTPDPAWSDDQMFGAFIDPPSIG